MKIWRVIKKAVTLQRKTGHVPVVFKFEKDDSLAQLVEHNTFNVGVVGSSPTRITDKISQVVELQLLGLFLFSKLSANSKFTSTFCQRSCAVNAVVQSKICYSAHKLWCEVIIL